MSEWIAIVLATIIVGVVALLIDRYDKKRAVEIHRIEQARRERLKARVVEIKRKRGPRPWEKPGDSPPSSPPDA